MRTKKQRCSGLVYIKDVPRYSGRGPSGFTMHYSEEQCARFTTSQDRRCWQHKNALEAHYVDDEPETFRTKRTNR